MDEVLSSDNEPATKGDVRIVKDDVRLLKDDVHLLKDDVRLLKDDVRMLKDDVRMLSGDLRSVRDDVSRDMKLMGDSIITTVRAEMRDLLRPITITLANHTAELADIRGYIKDNLVTRNEFHSRMDAFTGRADNFDYSAAKNRDRLDDHEKRLNALEEKRS